MQPSPPKRSVLGVMFLTVFLDIVGFSILFPLFPDLLQHYLAVSSEGGWFTRLIARLNEWSSGDETAVIALFGGLLGSIYGLLQFLFSPIWGALSDRVGRRPTLLVTLCGTALSYLLWAFAGGFGVLILARVLGGIMAGNISTASAAIADTTTAKERAKGMGIIGMAIGLGFIAGPAIGGWTGSYHLAELKAQPAGMLALNPFSVSAFAALALALVNLVWVAARFGETFPAERRGAAGRHPLSPFARIRSLDRPGVPRTNSVYFLYLVAFAAIEFTLTFLTKERFDYAPRDQAWMFVFVGLVIAFVQGGLVRRVAPKYGERLVARIGLVLTVPGFALIGLAQSVGMLYGGLAFMAFGSALVMPCLSALISRYTPAAEQGFALGSFRAMGSLARATGPVIGALVYWRFASAAPYHAGAVFLVVPIVLAWKLPAPPEDEPGSA